jgi:hypothetical protein
MRHFLTTITRQQSWPIDEERYHSLLASKQRILAWLQIEEVFGYVVEWWCDMEAHIHGRSLRSQGAPLSSTTRRARFFEDRANADRLMLAFLSATRMYLDHVATHVPQVAEPDTHFANSVKTIRNRYRGRSGFFIVADTLRNIVQHESYGVNRVSYSSAMLGRPTADASVQCALSLPVTDLTPIVSKLEDMLKPRCHMRKHSGNRESRIRHEISLVRAIRLPCELRTIMRHFCADLATMHDEVRAGVQAPVEEAIRVCEEAYKGHHVESQGESGVLACTDANGEMGERGEWIGSAAVERLRHLRECFSGWETIRTSVYGAPVKP